MALSIANKALIGGISSVALGGTIYGAYSYSTAAVSIKDALIRNSKNPLNLDANAGEGVDFLKELTKQHFTSNPKGKTKIIGLVLKDADNTEALKKECQKLFVTNSKDKDYQRKLREAEEWCTKENAPRKISSLLPKGKVLLVEGDGDKWDKPWSDFKQDYKNNDPVGDWAIATWNDIKEKGIAEASAFKQKCIAIGAGSLVPNTEKDLLAKIERYCTKTVSG